MKRLCRRPPDEDLMDEALIKASDDLWTISRTGGGVDNVDLKAATELGDRNLQSGVNARPWRTHPLTDSGVV